MAKQMEYRRLGQVHENLAALDVLERLDDATVDRIDKAMA